MIGAIVLAEVDLPDILLTGRFKNYCTWATHIPATSPRIYG